MKSKKAKPKQEIDYNQITLHSSYGRSGISIQIRYFGYDIHNVLIVPSEYNNWKSMNSAQKVAIIANKIDKKAIDGDTILSNLLVNTIIDVIDSIIHKVMVGHALRVTLPKY